MSAIRLLYDPKMKETPDPDGNYLCHTVFALNMEQYIPIMECLIQLGENINQVSQKGETALSTCLRNGFAHEQSNNDNWKQRETIAKQLLAWGADINQIAQYGCKYTTTMNTLSSTVAIKYLDENTKQTVNLEVPYTMIFPKITKGNISESMHSGITTQANANQAILPHLPQLTFGIELEEQLKNQLTALLLSQPQLTTQVQSQPDYGSLLHSLLVAVHKNPKTEREKLEIRYSLTVMQFLTKNGIDMGLTNTSRQITAIEAAELYEQSGTVYLLTPAYKAWCKKVESNLQQTLSSALRNNEIELVMQYLCSKHR